MRKRTAVIGVGNVLMADEGAGVEALKELERLGCPNNVELIDAGTAFFAIVADLKDFEKLIILDVARGGQAPGTVYRFKMEDIKESDFLLSLHDIGVVDSLKMESLVGNVPKDIVFFGIEPQEVEFAIGLSSPVKEKIGYLAQKVMEELENDCASWFG